MATLSETYLALFSLLMSADPGAAALDFGNGHDSQPESSSESACVPEEGPGLDLAILKIASYRRFDSRLGLDMLNPVNQIATDSIPRDTTITPSPAEIGQNDRLSNLPPELLYNVLKYTDIASVFRLRHTSRYLRNTIAADQTYQKLQAHCPQIYRSLLRNKQAKHIALAQLYAELCTENCRFCGSFGGFFNLLYLKRTCSNCIHRDPKLRVDSEEFLKSVHDMSASSLQAVPSMHVHTNNPPTYARSKVFATASLGLPDLRYSDERSSKFMSDQISVRDAVTSPMPFYDVASDTLSRGVNCAGCKSDMMRAAEIYTIGTNRLANANKIYSNKAFLEHYRTCESAQQLFKEKCGRTARAKVADQTPALGRPRDGGED
ncbi:F-box domain protein [Ceratocystis platani]|uniref:F-box domain protein n=1 Tax=Ceratocystis fimbriata f. sp. platani TaxID=88771 RepID=A0A0F8AY94_CERFI|nr:F-box domain protein [Ceratocystis platani]